MNLKQLKEENSGPKILYLDQLFWIELGKVHYDRNPDRRFIPVYETLNTAVSENRLIIPFNYTNVIEVQKAKNVDQKRRFAEFLYFLSKGYSFVPHPFIELKEVENIVLQEIGKPVNNLRDLAIGEGIDYIYPRIVSSIQEPSSTDDLILDTYLLLKESIRRKNQKKRKI